MFHQWVQSLCGIHTVRYQGALGHVYYMNDLVGVIQQVRLRLHFPT